MRIYLDCWPCFMRQALSAGRRAGADADLQRHLLLATMEQLQALPPGATPPEIGARIHRLVRECTGIADPYAESKRAATERALALLPELRARLAAAPDAFETAVRIAIAGNIIDDGALAAYDLEATLERVLHAPLAGEGLEPLRAALERAESLLYLADNTGETVFDRAFIEWLDRPLTYAVKAAPIINDATRADAEAAGLAPPLVELIDSGSDAPGTPLPECSPAFRERFAKADLIIAKGQANYETLSTVDAPIVFLLQAKCAVIAEDLGLPVGSVVVRAADGVRRSS